MVYLGAFAVIIAAFMVWREYVGYLEGELYWCREMLSALRDLREKMKCYLTSPSDWAIGYYSEGLLECGFLKRLSSKEDILCAYRSSRSDMCISDKADEILTACFSRLGEGYLDTELESLELAIGKLGEEEARATSESLRRRKVAGAFLGACASGIVIMVI